MYIAEIKWSSYPPSEGIAIVSDGTLTVQAFTYGTTYKKGDTLHTPLHAFEPKYILRSETIEDYFSKSSSPMGYQVSGIIININEGIVKVGGILIEIENTLIPNDIEEGECVSFSCDRVDLW